MANRRMFSLDVVESDMFLDLSLSTQALYFHLGMRADDDGIVGSPKSIMRQINASEADMKALIENGYLIPFQSGVIAIADWKINNAIRIDRYHPTVYQTEKNLWQPSGNQLATNCHTNGIPNDNQMSYQRYTNGIPNDNQMTTNCHTNGIPNDNQMSYQRYTNGIPNDNQMTTNCHTNGIPNDNQMSYQMETEVRSGKDRLGKDRLEDTKPVRHKYGAYDNVLLSDEDMAKLRAEFPADWQERIERLSEYMSAKKTDYKNHLAVIRMWAKRDGEKNAVSGSADQQRSRFQGIAETI